MLPHFFFFFILIVNANFLGRIRSQFLKYSYDIIHRVVTLSIVPENIAISSIWEGMHWLYKYFSTRPRPAFSFVDCSISMLEISLCSKPHVGKSSTLSILIAQLGYPFIKALLSRIVILLVGNIFYIGNFDKYIFSKENYFVE